MIARLLKPLKERSYLKDFNGIPNNGGNEHAEENKQTTPPESSLPRVRPKVTEDHNPKEESNNSSGYMSCVADLK